MQQEINYSSPTISEVYIRTIYEPDPLLQYAQILARFEIDYSTSDKYLEVGKIDWVQGWILEISVITSQVESMLEAVLPLLIFENAPFKLVFDSDTARSMLAGQSGYASHAKIISIYPSDDGHALRLAHELIEVTASFKGPDIRTDRQLGNVLFTRYGAGNPVIRNNRRDMEEKFIYDPKGNLVKEPLSIPFQLPQGISWPFSDLASPIPSKKNTVLQDRYKPIAVLKEDAKGAVRKGLWLEKIYKIRWCVIKEGRKCMISDESGRDIHDRLNWQFELQKDLYGHIPIPKTYDLFQENGNTYLVMQFIKGLALDEVITNLHKGRSWFSMSGHSRLLILDYAEQILNLIETMHGKGYIHRDVAPYNFLVDKHQRLWAIDLELSYCLPLRKPFPPFRLGTVGFMSPEQEATMLPTAEQDIYSLGTNLILMLTGLFPGGFSRENPVLLKNQLQFFIGDHKLASVLADSLSIDPNVRPSIIDLRMALKEFRDKQSTLETISETHKPAPTPKMERLQNVISQAINGLSTPTLMTEERLWFSRTEEEDNLIYHQSKSLSIYKGFYQGLSGVVYVLAQAYRAGFSISSCLPAYENSVSLICENAALQLINTAGGLFTGTAGMALGLIEGIESGLLRKEPTLTSNVRLYLQNGNLVGCGIAKGLAGKGLVLLRAVKTLNDPELVKLLQRTVDQLLALQQKDGSWLVETSRTKQNVKAPGMGHGTAGILFFLLEYAKQYRDAAPVAAITKSLAWLIKQAREQDGRVIWYGNEKHKEPDLTPLNGVPGVIFSLIKAYELTKDPIYRQLAEKALPTLTEKRIDRDLTLNTGLSGLGELYLEGARVFESETWQSHADWIVQVLLHYLITQPDGSCYWSTSGIPLTTPGLMTGNSGVLHFLIRYYLWQTK
jgi:serine/threonine protein kinase